jgi:hypothetical protein
MASHVQWRGSERHSPSVDFSYHVAANSSEIGPHQGDVFLPDFIEFSWAWFVVSLLGLLLDILRNQQVTGSIPAPSTNPRWRGRT